MDRFDRPETPEADQFWSCCQRLRVWKAGEGFSDGTEFGAAEPAPAEAGGGRKRSIASAASIHSRTDRHL